MTTASLPRARRNVAVLVLAQAILGSQITMIFTIGALAGMQLAPNACLSTLPITMIVLGSTTTAPWLSALMQRKGRRFGFWIGATGGLIGSAIAAYALYDANFWLLLLGSYFTGIYQSAQGFYRFAATDTAPESYKPKAISLVLAGGLVSAVVGPQLVRFTGDMTVIPFLGAYLVAMGINLVGMIVFVFLDIPTTKASTTAEIAGRSYRALLRDPRITVAIICGLVSYALMNLVMTSTPLAVVGCGFGQDQVSNIVTVHVLAMFMPSFFTGHLIARFGSETIIAIGLAILALAGITALTGVSLENFYIALFLLGIGWNFGYIGATAMLTSAHAPHERGRVQGMNDMIVFGGVMIASLASGGLLNCSGGTVQDGWSAVNLAMLPLLTLAGGALIWLILRPRGSA